MAGNSKNFLPPFKIITAGDMSQASLTSLITDIRNLDNIALQLVMTGTPTGTFAVQTSLDYNPTTGVAGTFIPLTLSPAPAATGGAQNIYIDLNQIAGPYMRVVYTRSAGSGTLDVHITGKSV